MVLLSILSEAGELRGFKCGPSVFGECLWVMFDPDFIRPADGDPQFFIEEASRLSSISVEDLRLIQEAKAWFPRGRIIQEGPEQEPHEHQFSFTGE